MSHCLWKQLCSDARGGVSLCRVLYYSNRERILCYQQTRSCRCCRWSHLFCHVCLSCLYCRLLLYHLLSYSLVLVLFRVSLICRTIVVVFLFVFPQLLFFFSPFPLFWRLLLSNKTKQKEYSQNPLLATIGRQAGFGGLRPSWTSQYFVTLSTYQGRPFSCWSFFFARYYGRPFFVPPSPSLVCICLLSCHFAKIKCPHTITPLDGRIDWTFFLIYLRLDTRRVAKPQHLLNEKKGAYHWCDDDKITEVS